MTPGVEHDPHSWDFRFLLDRWQFHLHETLKNQVTMLYWLMRIGDSIVEVGAGSGRACILAKRLNPQKRVVAVDVTPETCQVIREYAALAKVDIEVVEADALRLPFASGEFGVAFSVGVLEHYPNEWIIAALREQCRIAEAVIVSVPLAPYMATFKSAHGDERSLSKAEWLNLIGRVAPVVEFNLIGDPIEEYWLIAMLDARYNA